MRFELVFFLLFLFSACDTKNETQQFVEIPDNAQVVPLGGNSYVTVAGNAGHVSDEGFADWADPKTVFSTYFRVNKEGDLKLFLNYNSKADGSLIDITCKGKTFSLSLPQTASDSDTTIFIGAIEKCDTGYVRVDFQGKKKNTNLFADARKLILGGSASRDLSIVDDFSYYWGRRGPSVHLSYVMPENKTAEWFYNEVTVPEGEDKLGSYFMANGFGEGYFGIQVNSEVERRVLFSVWSPFETDDPSAIPEEHKIKLVKKGEGVKTGEFGNEGSGGQSYLVYNWKAGITYQFLTRVRPSQNGYSEYTSYFFDPENEGWRLIAQFLRPGTTTYYTRAHSFLENFLTETGYQQRKACYNNQWIYTTEGEWVELIQARFTADNTARHGARMDYKGGCDENGFFLQNCGFFNDYTSINTLFDRISGNMHPQIDWNSLK